MKSIAASLALVCYILYCFVRSDPVQAAAAAFVTTATDTGGGGGPPVVSYDNYTALPPGVTAGFPPLDQLITDNTTMVLATLMLLTLVWFLNREFEIAYRLSVHGNMQVSVAVVPYAITARLSLRSNLF